MNTMSYTYQETITLERLCCGKCGITFAVPQLFVAERRADGGGWHCPNGHERVFAEPEVDRLRRALTAAKCETLRERQLREQADRKLRRVNRGVCPCCKRSFQNLARHMKTKHSTTVNGK